MKKNVGKPQQIRGKKRHIKGLKKKLHKQENLAYVSRLMFKYGKDLKLNPGPAAGEKYLKEILGV